MDAINTTTLVDGEATLAGCLLSTSLKWLVGFLIYFSFFLISAEVVS